VRTRILVLLVALLAVLGASTCVHARSGDPEGASIQTVRATPGRRAIGVLRSEPNLQAGGWRASWELGGVAATFGRLGLECREVRPADLEAGGWAGDLLVLADVRRM